MLFRDEDGRYGLIDRALPASRRRSRLRPAGEWRPALRLPWLAVRCRRQMPGDAGRAEGIQPVQERHASAPIRWSRRAASSGPISAKASRRRFRRSTVSSRPTATPSRSRAYINCNWLQALEVGIDPAHASFLHRFFEDEDTVGRLRQAVPRRLGRQRHADDEDPARIRPPDHQCRAHRVRPAPDRAARDRRGAHPCARHQPAVPARLRHSDEHGDDDHAVACAGR